VKRMQQESILDKY